MIEPFFNEEDFACGRRAVQEAVRGTIRSPALQAFLDALAENLDITDEFQEASDHRYDCRCEKCLAWWATVGPEDHDEEGTPLYGPFSADEVEQYRRERR